MTNSHAPSSPSTPTASLRPPKLCRPSASGLVARERLFALLDRFRRRPITWIEAPPGSGKTALASSWIEARDLECQWYEVDGGDADPATLFHFLRLDDTGGNPSQAALTPEYRGDLPGFTRRFFTDWFNRRPQLKVFVLDNFQQAAPDGGYLSDVVLHASAVLPNGVNLVVLSRDPPPQTFAVAIAHAEVARVLGTDLRLDPSEIARLGPLPPSDGQAAAAIHRQTNGWAAGVRLMLESRHHGDPPAFEGRPETPPTALFDYLAFEVFERSSQEMRDLWLSTAWLPWFTSDMAASLSGNDGASSLLEDLAARRYFIDRRNGAEPRFEYHALFRDFLRSQAERLRGPDHRRDALTRSARMLVHSGDPEAAFELFCEARDFDSAIPLVRAYAGSLLEQGRSVTLSEALESLPAARLEEDPWLLFWLGAAQAASSPPRGRESVQRAHRRFVRAGDPVGQAMCISVVLDTMWAEWNHLARFGPWIDAARRVMDMQPAFPSRTAELRFWSSLLAAFTNALPSDPLAETAVERTLSLLEDSAGVNEKVIAASNLLQYLIVVGQTSRIARVKLTLAALLELPAVTPLSRLSALHAIGFVANAMVDPAAGVQAMSEAAALVDQEGFAFARLITRLFHAWMQVDAGRIAAAADAIAALAPQLDSARPNEAAMGYFLQAWCALLEGAHQHALSHAERAVRIIDGIEAVGPWVCCHSIHAIALTRCGQVESALDEARRARRMVGRLESGALRMLTFLAEADALFAADRRVQACEALSEALATGRRNLSFCTGIWLPDMMSALCAEALQAGIEPEYATRLIETRGLKSPSRDIEAWPWKVRVYTLGRFDIQIQGRERHSGRKAQRRVLDLLKAIIAAGGDTAHREALSAAIWPDLDGIAARKAFDIALHRLRRLLGRDDAVHLLHGEVQLDPALVWTDAGTFERVGTRCLAGVEFDLACADHALTLYQGGFLATEDEHRWLLPARDRIRSRYVRLAVRAGAHLEQTGDRAAAMRVYASTLEKEPLAEEVYQRLIACLIAEGRNAEALDVYRRCRQMLSIVLGLVPSTQTESLRQTIVAGTVAKP